MPKKKRLYLGLSVHTAYPEIKSGVRTGRVIVVLAAAPGEQREKLVVEGVRYRAGKTYQAQRGAAIFTVS